METDESKALEHARKLLALQASKKGKGNEQNEVQPILRDLLESLGLETRPEHQTGGGKPVDIYLPRQRVLIEVKSTGSAFVRDPHKTQSRRNNESAFDQLRGYVERERYKELSNPSLLSEKPDRPWIGAVTDGRVWHTWEFPHEAGAQEKKIDEGLDFQVLKPEKLVEYCKRLAGDTSKKPSIQGDITEQFKVFLDPLRKVHGSATTNVKGELYTRLPKSVLDGNGESAVIY